MRQWIQRGWQAVPRRWLRNGLLAVGLFAIHAASRLVVRFWFEGNTEREEQIGIAALVGVALAMTVMAIIWGRVRPVGELVADLAGAGFAGGLLILFVGPFLSGANFWVPGLDIFLVQAGLYAGYAVGGALLGLCLVILFGRDYLSRSLTQFAESKLAKPRRAVRA